MLKRREIIRDAEKLYHEPRNVLEDGDLSDADKIRILESWEADLLEQQRASDENMPSATGDGVAEQLQKVIEALETLRDT